jgi:hypothetical protein
MLRRHHPLGMLIALVLAFASSPPALADDETPSYRGPASAAEMRFVRTIQADLGKRPLNEARSSV